MKYLSAIPCLHGANLTNDAIQSAQEGHILIIDNGADADVKKVIERYDATVIRNDRNIYVNPAWNQALDYFLHSFYDVLLILNSDIVLPQGWTGALDSFYAKYPDGVPLGLEVNDWKLAGKPVGELNERQMIRASIKGICIILTQQQAKKVYPIPEGIKVWFGDNWIYGNLEDAGYKIWHMENFVIYHAGSQNVGMGEVSEIIEQDKIEWERLQTT